MKHILLSALLLLSRFAFTQDDFEPIYRNALNPYAGMTKEEYTSYRNPFGKNYHSAEKYSMLEKKCDAFTTHIYSFDEDSLIFERKLAAFQLQEFKVGELTVRRYLPRQGNGVYTECYDPDQRLIAIHQQDVASYTLLDLNENLPSQYLVGEGLVLFSYSGNEPKQAVKYFLSPNGMPYDFDIFEEKELSAPLALFERADLEQMSSPFLSGNESHEGKLPEISPRQLFASECAHGHVCCASGCSCCPNFSYLESSYRFQTIDPTPIEAANENDPQPIVKKIQIDSLGRAILTKNAGQGIILKAFVLPHAATVYQFSDTKGSILAEYTSTLTGETFAAAYSGASEFNEFNENGEAWVVAADGTFCRINKSGEQVSLTLSTDELESMDSERISDSLYAVRFTVHEHLPYHIGNYVEEQFETIVLVHKNGKLVRYTKYSSIQPYTDKLFLVGTEAFQFTRDIERQKKMYGLVDRNFKLLTAVPYELINPPAEGLMRVKTEKGFGYIDMSGKEVIPCQYSGGTVFENGRAHVILGNEEYFINKAGKRIK